MKYSKKISFLALLVIGIAISSSGCSLKATRTANELKLEGFMGGKATWPDKASIEKDSLLKTPDFPVEYKP